MAPQPPRPPYSEGTLRIWWSAYRCRPELGEDVEIVPGFTRRVARPAAEAWALWGRVRQSYKHPTKKLGAWVCRYIGGTTTWSVHAYGIAVDEDAYDPNGFNYGWSWDKTDFTPQQVDALLAIRTNNGRQVFAWGGSWISKQDYMHWYIVCRPEDLETGINMATVRLGDGEEGEMIGPGDTGKAVVKIQEALLAAGYELPEWGADGDYGDETAAAVRDYQADEELDVTGTVGGVTAAFLIPGPAGPRGPRGRAGQDGETPDLSQYKLEPI